MTSAKDKSRGGGYVPDPNNPKKQVPAPLPPNAYDRSSAAVRFVFSKTPSYVIINKSNSSTGNGETGGGNIGFFFGSSASFAESIITHGNSGEQNTELSASAAYTLYGQPAAGTILNIHPTAWSGSAGDSVTFVYKSGLSTGPA